MRTLIDRHEDTRPRLTTGEIYEGNQQFRGKGRSRSCFKCGEHRPADTGGYRLFGTRKEWVAPCCMRPAEGAGQ